MQFFSEQECGTADIAKYKDVAPERALRELEELAPRVAGAHIIHVNSTGKGGGVAEMLSGQIPLERGLGLHSRWIVMKGNSDFFTITKKIHNALQGKSDGLTKTEMEQYLAHARALSGEFAKIVRNAGDRSVVLLHDPQPMALIESVRGVIPVISRLHIDLEKPDPDTMEFFRPFLMQFDIVVLSNAAQKPAWLPDEKFRTVLPAIDPVAEKNSNMDEGAVRDVLASIGIEPKRPLIAQISRFDPWKDPEGVVEAYRIVKKTHPDLSLALAGLLLANDDPEAREIFERIKNDTAGEPDIHLFGGSEPPAVLSVGQFVNALQRGATVVLQKSVREGFGLTVAEAMWKEAAVIGGNVGGIREQITDGVNGFLVSSIEECANRVAQLLDNAELRARLGKAAKETVRERFLMPRLVFDHLKLYVELLQPCPVLQRSKRPIPF